MLDALGNLGDFLGGIGVVVTLLYLAAQIRQNTKSSRSQAYQAAVLAVSNWTHQVGTSERATQILQKGNHEFDSLSSQERAQFTLLLGGFCRHLENLHFQFVKGAIDQALWAGWEQRVFSTFSAPGARLWWSEAQHYFSPDFQRLVARVEEGAVVPSLPPPDSGDAA